MQAVRALEKKKQKDAERTRKAAEEKAATLAKYCGNAGKDMQEIAKDAKKLAKSVSKNQIVNDAAKKLTKKAANKLEDNKRRQHIILRRLRQRQMLADAEIGIIQKMIARGHVATLGLLDFYCHNESDDASGDLVLSHQLKGIMQQAETAKLKDDGTIKDMAQSPKVGNFKAIVRSKAQRPKSLGEVVVESLPAIERTPSPLASPERTKKVQNSLRCATKKLNAMTNALKCLRCNSKICSCPFFKGTVTVSGLHFPKCGLLKKCDSYCIVTYGDTVLHTTRLCNNTYDPVWNEDIEITVQTHDECKELTFEVYSDRDNSIGSVIISSAGVAKLLQNSRTVNSYLHDLNNLKPIIGHDKVESTLNIHLTTLVLESNLFKGKVTVLSGSHFPKCDTWGKCDAYCKVKYGKSVLLLTSCCKNTYDPVWNESFGFLVPNILECEELIFELYERDGGDFFTNGDSLIGQVILDPEEFLQNFQSFGTTTHVLRTLERVIGHDEEQSALKLNIHPEILRTSAISQDEKEASYKPSAAYLAALAQAQKLVYSVDEKISCPEVKLEIAKKHAYYTSHPVNYQDNAVDDHSKGFLFRFLFR